MRALSAHPQGLSLGGIAAEVGLPRSTVQRIVTALVAENLLEPAGAAGGFRLGPALGQLLYQTEADIVPRHFAFRAEAPLIDGAPFALCLARDGAGAKLWARDAAGRATMRAKLS